MKNLLPEFQTKKEAFAYLRTNKAKLIAQKKALPTTSDDLEFGYTKTVEAKTFGTKTESVIAVVDGELPVDIIANMSGWCDSQMDVMLKDSWKKSISEVSASGQKIFYHLKNHDYEIDAILGKDPTMYAKDIDLSIFNITTDIKKAQGLIMASIVMKLYDEKAYNLYNDGQVKQHSIGLQYIQIVLCLDSTEEEDIAEKKNWDKYYPQVINKDKVDNYGYFWAVIEAKILEVSAVLFGANILTPVLSDQKNDTAVQPPLGTEGQPSQFDLMKAIKSMVMCQNCMSTYSTQDSGSSNCPSCGRYNSPDSNAMEVGLFNTLNAIAETKLF